MPVVRPEPRSVDVWLSRGIRRVRFGVRWRVAGGLRLRWWRSAARFAATRSRPSCSALRAPRFSCASAQLIVRVRRRAAGVPARRCSRRRSMLQLGLRLDAVPGGGVARGGEFGLKFAGALLVGCGFGRRPSGSEVCSDSISPACWCASALCCAASACSRRVGREGLCSSRRRPSPAVRLRSCAAGRGSSAVASSVWRSAARCWWVAASATAVCRAICSDSVSAWVSSRTPRFSCAAASCCSSSPARC